MKLPVHEVTTRHSRSLFPLQVDSGLPSAGCLIGWDAITNAGFVFDPWVCYDEKVNTDLCMLVLGNKGLGKSAFTKAFLLREVGCFGRSAYILDPKGEYADVASHLGMWQLRLEPGGQSRLNPLDAPAASSRDDVHKSRIEILCALAASGLGRPCTPRETNGITEAVTAAESTTSVLLLPLIVDLMMHPTAKMAVALGTTAPQLAAETREVASSLRMLVVGPLSGMFDGPSTVEMSVTGTGGLIDLSPIQRTPAALGPVMVCALSWLSQVIPTPPPPSRILVVDEAWHLTTPETIDWLNMVSKLSRKWLACLLLVTQHLSDFRSAGDDSSQAAKKATSLVSDIQTKVMFGEAESAADDTAAMIGLSSVERAMLPTLPQGQCFFHIGTHRALVRVALTNAERRITNTDDGGASKAPAPPPQTDLQAGTLPAHSD